VVQQEKPGHRPGFFALYITDFVILKSAR